MEVSLFALLGFGNRPDLIDALPADEQEQERLDIHHALMMALMDDKLHFAPIDSNIQRAIDLGTGTGTMTADIIYFSADYD